MTEGEDFTVKYFKKMNYKDLKPHDFEVLPVGDTINALQIKLDTRIDTIVYIFRNISENHSCLLQSVPGTGKLPIVRGVNIVHETFGKPDEEKLPFIHLECTLPAYQDNFTVIIREILADFDNSSADMEDSVNKIISKWKHFLSAPPIDLMPEEEILGLLGELMLLERLTRMVGSKAVEIWTADRGEEDFIKDINVVEVKSTLKERHEHIINGIDQLLIVPDRRKYILSLLFTKKEGNDSLSLPKLIKSVSQTLANYPEAYDSFFRKLHHRNYDPRDAEDYQKFQYALIKGGFFKVNEAFPKLTTTELSIPLNPRVSRVRYLLDMEGIENIDFVETDDNSLRFIFNYE